MSSDVIPCQETIIGLLLLFASVFGQYLGIYPYQYKNIFSSLVHVLFMTLRVLCVSLPAFSKYFSLPLGSSVIVLFKFLLDYLLLISKLLVFRWHLVSKSFELASLRPMVPLPSRLTGLEFSVIYFNQLVLHHWSELNFTFAVSSSLLLCTYWDEAVYRANLGFSSTSCIF